MRVVIPAPLKELFSVEAKNKVVCTLGKHNSILIYPLDNWYALREKMFNGSDQQRKHWGFLVHWASTEQELEGPGRIRIPEKLLAKADLLHTDKLIIKGQDSFITLWHPERFASIVEPENEEVPESLDFNDIQV
jgi:DNA-binding transcriptional regulator/RsmH inhibitor MraZ